MRIFACLGIALSLAVRLPGQGAVLQSAKEMAGRVEPSRLTRTVDRLAAFGTRHTLSEPLSETRGIGAARLWLGQEFEGLTRLPGSRLVAFQDRFQAPPSPLLPKGAELVNLGVLLPGTDPDRQKEALVVVAHYDSRGSNVMDGSSSAPGAVDNGSGVAVTLEMAHVLAAEAPAIGIYFVATAAGEQGLLGSARLAQRLKAEGIEVVGMVAADCVGNSSGPGGTKSSSAVRLFSAGLPDVETEGQKRIRELLGSENDSPARELARYLKRSGERYVENLDCAVMLRRDRIGRGGEQEAFVREGFPGVRVTEQVDNYDRQHQDVRSETGRSLGDTAAFFDTGYCAKITRMLVTGFRQLSCAPAAPQNVGLGGCGSSDTKLWWTLPADPRITGVVVYRRRADGVLWQQDHAIGRQESLVLPGVSPDTYVFALATVDAQGNESLPVTPMSVEY